MGVFVLSFANNIAFRTLSHMAMVITTIGGFFALWGMPSILLLMAEGARGFGGTPNIKPVEHHSPSTRTSSLDVPMRPSWTVPPQQVAQPDQFDCLRTAKAQFLSMDRDTQIVFVESCSNYVG